MGDPNSLTFIEVRGDLEAWRKKGKGLQRQCLIGLAVAGFNNAKTTTKASATGLDARPDEYN